MSKDQTECRPGFWEHCESLISKLYSPLKPISAVVIILVMLIAVIDVFGRTFFSMPLLGSMELTEILMVVMIFPMFPYIMLKDKHMAVDMLVSRFSAGIRASCNIFWQVLSMCYVGLLSKLLFSNAIEQFAYGESSYIYSIPLCIFMGFAALCFALFALALFVHSVTEYRKASCLGKTPHALFAIAIAIILAIIPIFFADIFASLNNFALGGLVMLYMFTLILLSMPIGMAMLVAGFQGILIIMPTTSIAFAMVSSAPYASVAAIHLSVVPMFLLMGELALIGGISVSLFATANAWLGRLPGGLAVSTVAGCAGFAAVCGESIPTAMTMASVSMPEMRRHGYDPAFSAACLSLGGTLGILIPPSLGFIIYSIIVEESVGKLFMAGIIPGLLLVVVISCIIIIRAIINPKLAPRGDATTWAVKFHSLLGLIPMLLLFGVIIGGILTGLCSPTEGGAVGAMSALVYSVIRGKVSFQILKKACEETAVLAGKVFFVLTGVAVLGPFLAASEIPFELAAWVTESGMGKWAVLFATIVLFIVLGCLMNVIPMISLTLPALFPTIMAFGFDPIWFGVICVLLMELGQITPPIGVLVFALSGVVPDVPVEQIFKQISPFFLGILLVIGLIILFPGIALWLPNTLM